jgi:predicted homoserine dehydrogenase-like protein
VAINGAGYSARNIAYQIVHSVPGMRVAAIVNRSLDHAREACSFAGIAEVGTAASPRALETAIAQGRCAVTHDPAVVCEAAGIDALIEATGTVEYAAGVVLRAIHNKKHVILINVELDATLGPLLKAEADRAGVIYSNTDGDEPAAAMNLIRYVRCIGLKPVVAGNLKGLYDRYRTPETQHAFAAQYQQKPATVTSFADGTKLSMELAVLANAAGFGVGTRGMYGPTLGHVNDSSRFYQDKFLEGGMVDFLVATPPAFGVFVLGYSEDAVKAAFLKYFKMGAGPLYTFYAPFHLPPLETPLTVARAVLFGDAAVAPAGRPRCDAVAVAKRNLKAGEVLDGPGGFTCYALLENYEVSRRDGLLPMGVSEGCRLVREVARDQALTYRDVQLPEGRLCDRLRREQEKTFPEVPQGAGLRQ